MEGAPGPLHLDSLDSELTATAEGRIARKNGA